MIRKKFMLSVAVIICMIICIAASTYSYYSRTAQSPLGSIATGSLYIGGTGGQRGVLDSLVDLPGLVPGGAPQNFDIKVKNLGTMTAYLNALAVSINDGDDKFAANAIDVACTDGSGNLLYSGSLLGLDQNPVPLAQQIVLAQGATTDLHLSMQLDIRATGWYQGRAITFSVMVYAVQNPDQGISGLVKLANAGNAQSVIDSASPGEVVLLAPGSYPALTNHGVSLKAEGLVFDTVIAHLDLEGGAGSPVLVQGFSFNAAGSGPALTVNSPGGVTVSDNVFNGRVDPISVQQAGRAVFTRNDVSGTPFALPAGVTGKDNLGLDVN
jgi:hypothetical protein